MSIEADQFFGYVKGAWEKLRRDNPNNVKIENGIQYVRHLYCKSGHWADLVLVKRGQGMLQYRCQTCGTVHGFKE